MDISEDIKNQYLSPRDVKTGDLITFLNEGQKVKSFNRMAHQFEVELSDGSVFKFTVNKRSLRNLAEVWGLETKDWIGRQAIVEVTTELIDGKDTNVIYLTPSEIKGAEIKQEDIPVIESDEPAKTISKPTARKKVARKKSK